MTLLRTRILSEILHDMTIEELQLLKDEVLTRLIDTRKYLKRVEEEEEEEEEEESEEIRNENR